MSPPETRTTTQEPFGLAPIGADRQQKPSSRVEVVNPCWNGLTRIRRKDADFYVLEGRALWVEGGMLRLVDSHPKNLAAAARAAGGNGVIERLQLPAENIPFMSFVLPHGPGQEILVGNSRRTWWGPRKYIKCPDSRGRPVNSPERTQPRGSIDPAIMRLSAFGDGVALIAPIRSKT